MLALANQAGLATGIRAVSGLDLCELDDTRLSDMVEETTIFGRVTPNQKEQLVRVLLRAGSGPARPVRRHPLLEPLRPTRTVERDAHLCGVAVVTNGIDRSRIDDARAQDRI